MSFREERTYQGSLRGAAFYDPPSDQGGNGFGTTWVLEEETDYYANAMEWIEHIPGTDDVTCHRILPNMEGVKRLTPGGLGGVPGTPVYSVGTGANIEASGTRRGQAENTADSIYFAYRLSPATYQLQRCNAATGALQAVVNAANGGHGCCLNSDASVGFSVVSGANGLRKFDPQALGSPIAHTNYTLTGDSATLDNIIDREDTALITLDSARMARVRYLDTDPGSGSWAIDLSIDLTVHFSTVANEAWCAHVPGTNQFWVAYNNNHTAHKYDTDGNLLASVNPRDHLGVGSGTIRGIACDINGDLYVLYHNAGVRNDVLRYNAAGELITSTFAQGITLDITIQPADITITSLTGQIWLANVGADNGHTSRISQAA